jgi:hypothetical protein
MSTRHTTSAEERLPSETPRAATRRGVALMLLLALAVTALANAAALALSNPPWLSPDRRIIGTKFQLLRERAADVVIVGDSSAAFGVNASVLGAELGASAVNLATFGRFELAGSAWTLDECLAQHPAPKLVVAMHGARTWWLEASGFDLAQLPLEPGYWTRRAPTRSVDVRRLGEFALDRWVPLYTQHASFARALRGGAFGVPERPAIAPDGTMVLGEEEARWANPEGFLERTVLPELAARAPGVPERHRRAAEALAERAARDGFDLVFVSAPCWDHLALVPEHVAVIEESERFLAELAARSPRVHLVPGGPRYFTRDEVENPYHLRDAAAAAYTRELAVALRALLPPR